MTDIKIKVSESLKLNTYFNQNTYNNIFVAFNNNENLFHSNFDYNNYFFTKFKVNQ